jgi:flavorubredoxin
MKIAVGDGASYRRVEASVLAGEIQALALNRTTGGVFRSFSWSGTGNYDLRARLTAGEIHLRER